ncbi:DUF6020 family protein [Metabacillus idriensis]|uniref:DUF6020 family protein n=1 Tax=Metabacillus idriensis TaxID=324768 RepID=UPI0017494C63|nr:DUF6020 family protein [Metabacillus idriensis]
MRDNSSTPKYVYLGVITVTSILLGVLFLFFYYPIRNINVGLTIIICALLAFCIWKMVQYMYLWFELTLIKKIISICFLSLFSILILLSSKGEQIHLQDNHLFIVILSFFGAFISVFTICTAITLSFLRIHGVKGEKQLSKSKIMIYALPSILVWITYWIAFFPAGMTPDSLAQWDQAHTGQLDNWHPVVYTLLIMFLTQIWDNPAIVSLFQIVIIAGIIGYTCYRLEKFNFPKWSTWTLAVFFAISPVNSIYSITIWKDVLYSAFLLLFIVLVFNIVKTKGLWIKSKSHFFFFIITSLSLIFFRHNGFPVFIVTMILILVFYWNVKKQVIIGLTSVAIIYLLVTGPVFNILGVKPSDPNEALSIPTQQLATIIIEDGNISESQEEYLNEIFPIELWKERFNPYNTNPIKFSWGEYNREVIFDDTKKYFSTWLELCIQNPKLALKGFFTHTSLVWQIHQPKEPGYTDTFVTNVYYGNKQGLENTIINEKITLAANKYLTVTKEMFGSIIWRPANYAFMILLLTFIGYLRNDFRIWFVSLPLLLNTAAVMAALPAQDFRYLYSNTLVVYIAIFLAFTTYSNKRLENEKIS